MSKYADLEQSVNVLRTQFNAQFQAYKKLNEKIQDLKNRIDDLQNKQETHGEFKVGDNVQFRLWDDMAVQYGVDADGDITLPGIYFSQQMKGLCGTYATIEGINGDFVYLKDFSYDGYTGFNYTLDMLKLKCEFKVGDKVRDIHNQEIVTIKEIQQTKDGLIYEVKDKYGFCWQTSLIEPYTEPRWTFTDDEKAILRNLPEKYKWIARDEDGAVFISFTKPHKYEDRWDIDDDVYGDVRSSYIWQFNHLFKSIEWTDKEPCQFRKYL